MENIIKQIKKEFKQIKNPYIFFDNDADGFCSFYQIAKYFDTFSFTMVKDRPLIDERFSYKLDETSFDAIIILDIAKVDESFLKKYSGYKIIWIDHHPQSEIKSRNNLIILNSTDFKKDYPTSMLVYKIFKKEKLAMIIGCISDWYIDRTIKSSIKKLQLDQLINKKETPGEILFDSSLGEKILFLNFSLKSNVTSFKRYILELLEINLLNLDTEENPFFKKAKRIYDKYYAICNYKPLINDDLYYLKYYEDVSVSTEVSNFLLVKYPKKKIIIVARDAIDKISMSLRSNGHVNLTELMSYVFSQMNGFGGGHNNASGCSIAKDDEDFFIEIIKNSIKML
ncbi:MAG: DHHA1 domain-containing protein [Candidatus Nanoarchaeia archaeon]|nr:DHHA1 domain-containing protein [Candidatus Nanoarchaeia archaeon]